MILWSLHIFGGVAQDCCIDLAYRLHTAECHNTKIFEGSCECSVLADNRRLRRRWTHWSKLRFTRFAIPGAFIPLILWLSNPSNIACARLFVMQVRIKVQLPRQLVNLLQQLRARIDMTKTKAVRLHVHVLVLLPGWYHYRSCLLPSPTFTILATQVLP